MYASNCLSGCQNDPIIKLLLFFCKIETFLFLNITVLVMALKYTQNKVIGLSDIYPYQIFDTSASSALKTF